MYHANVKYNISQNSNSDEKSGYSDLVNWHITFQGVQFKGADSVLTLGCSPILEGIRVLMPSDSIKANVKQLAARCAFWDAWLRNQTAKSLCELLPLRKSELLLATILCINHFIVGNIHIKNK